MGERKARLGIYKITCIKNNRIYIGKSIDVYGRIQSHKWSLGSNTHRNKKLQRDFNEYGEESFIFEIEKYVDTPLEMYYYESYYAEKYDVFNTGYNIVKLSKSTSIKKIIDNLEHYVNLFTKLTDKVPNDGYCIRAFKIDEKLERFFSLDSYDISVMTAIMKTFINFREGLNIDLDIDNAVILFTQLEINNSSNWVEEFDI